MLPYCQIHHIQSYGDSYLDWPVGRWWWAADGTQSGTPWWWDLSPSAACQHVKHGLRSQWKSGGQSAALMTTPIIVSATYIDVELLNSLQGRFLCFNEGLAWTSAWPPSLQLPAHSETTRRFIDSPQKIMWLLSVQPWPSVWSAPFRTDLFFIPLRDEYRNVKDAAWCSHGDVRSRCFKILNILEYACPSNRGMATDLHVAPQTEHQGPGLLFFSINPLQDEMMMVCPVPDWTVWRHHVLWCPMVCCWIKGSSDP